MATRGGRDGKTHSVCAVSVSNPAGQGVQEDDIGQVEYVFAPQERQWVALEELKPWYFPGRHSRHDVPARYWPGEHNVTTGWMPTARRRRQREGKERTQKTKFGSR